MIEKTIFEYLGYHFKPLKKLPVNLTFNKISQYLNQDRELGFSTYDWKKADYDYNDFYTAANNSEYDIFKCIENNFNYIPCDNELFLYGKK